MKVYISTAERSGFLYAKLLSQEIKRKHPEAQILGCSEGSEDLAPVGFAAGAGAAKPALTKVREIEHEVRCLKPDVFLAVSWSEPNTLLGLRLRNMPRMRRYFFAPPQLWAWGRWRAILLRRGYQRLFALYPKEALFLRSLGLRASFAGNPLAAYIRPYLDMRRTAIRKGARKIALLAGSRELERSRHTGLLVDFMKLWRERYPRDRAVWLAPTPIEAEGLKKLADPRDLVVAGEERHRELASASLALVASGTASLEAALAGAPQVVFYCLPRIEVALARTLTKVERFALPNLILGEDAVTELLNPSLDELVSVAEETMHRRDEHMGIALRLHNQLQPLDKSHSFLSM